jgi:hypothetical protein
VAGSDASVTPTGRASGEVVFHLSSYVLRKPFAERPLAFRKLHTLFETAGNRVIERVTVPQTPIALAEGALNLVWDVSAPTTGAFNLAPAYLPPFCYFDPRGVYGASSLAQKVFQASDVPAQQAQARMRMLKRFFKDKRESRIPQPQETETFPKNAIAVFLQGYSGPVERLKYVSEEDMLAAVLKDTGGRPVIIKPHPNTRDIETFDRLAALADRPDVTITFANIHDILDACAMTVSVCSSVGVEGMIHEKPSIVFGRTDFHHCATSVTRAQDWPAAQETALQTDWPYGAFLSWLFDEHMLNFWREDLGAQVASKLAQRGIDPARFNLPQADG